MTRRQNRCRRGQQGHRVYERRERETAERDSSWEREREERQRERERQQRRERGETERDESLCQIPVLFSGGAAKTTRRLAWSTVSLECSRRTGDGFGLDEVMGYGDENDSSEWFDYRSSTITYIDNSGFLVCYCNASKSSVLNLDLVYVSHASIC